jgi:hypothetical protein
MLELNHTSNPLAHYCLSVVVIINNSLDYDIAVNYFSKNGAFLNR